MRVLAPFAFFSIIITPFLYRSLLTGAAVGPPLSLRA